MERPKNISDPKTAQLIRIILIFHVVGFVGLSLVLSRPLFLHLVPFHLLLMMVILIISHNKRDSKFMLFFLVVFIAGFMAEWLGVHTGILFGNYQYGKTLGIRLDGIPIIMGVNWFLLIYAAGTALQQVAIKQMWLRVLIGATGLMALDVLIEPIAIKFDYWHWASPSVPVANYVCWFAISVLLLFVFEVCRFKTQSIVGAVLLVSQFLFFLGLLANTLI
ncbi:carotenoid biosynthesis protein [Mucilaginibacter antarcticus]|uniref:Carotenoid biosynthesis protein n=1 Tax=Mucilaginibacter antarcticus TaxID=1855725 RepID=A0ABW5XMG8_9SPHI